MVAGRPLTAEMQAGELELVQKRMGAGKDGDTLGGLAVADELPPWFARCRRWCRV
jgi:hypothetical protein